MKYKKLFLLSFLNPLGLILTIDYANAQMPSDNQAIPIKMSESNNKNIDADTIENKAENKDEKFSLMPKFYSLSQDKNNLVAKELNKKEANTYINQ